MSVQKQKCSWNNKCELLKESTIKNTLLCDYHDIAVTPYTCQQLKSGLCKISCNQGMNSGLEGDYRCVEVRIDQLSTITCNQPGLNDQACLSIITEDQYCVFLDDQCKSIEPKQVFSCNQLNKNACISAMKHNQQQLLCEWIDSSCRIYKQNEFKCQTKNEVNCLVCASSQYLCMFDEKQKKCKSIEMHEINGLGCNTPGLSKKACLKITSQNCSFQNGICQQLNQDDLTYYKCNMDLNEKACVNLKTNSQFCLWNGNNCQELFINQNIDCPLYVKNSSIKMNGNVCQAISKPNVLCKYDHINNVCIKSSINDQCNTPFLNQFGCVSILNSKETCQWTVNGCQFVVIVQQLTTCESLGYANPNSCSQIYENDNIGCYFDKNKQQCTSILVNSDDKLIKQLLNTIKCDTFSLGLNKVMCGSITTEQTPCRWFQEQCVYLSKRSDIADVPCLHLSYSNYQACALASFQNEPCRYLENLKGCVNNIQKFTKCYTKGLNKFGCELSVDKCYYDKVQCIKAQEIDIINDNSNNQQANSSIIKIIYNSSQLCNTKFITKIECSSIITKGQLCAWSFTTNSCTQISVDNKYCQEFGYLKTIVNPNVCASINLETPEYCSFDFIQNSCKLYNEPCTTKCCTDKKLIGINANSCSRFSSKNLGDYCYFYDLKCQELTLQQVDISDSNLVKQFYNDNKLPCTSMNINSCHMIEWSTSQLCYYNGDACLNLKFSKIKNLMILTQYPIILNEYSCLAIEAMLTIYNKQKYFSYDMNIKRCKLLTITSQFPFAECEDAYGNKNLCTRYTGNNFCKWDLANLKCTTISQDEIGEIQTCNNNLNIKTCMESKKLNCFFSYDEDLCIQAPSDVDCDYFNQKGLVSDSVCKYISGPSQLCEYSEQDKTCIKSETLFDSCDVSARNANNRVCYNNTNGNCRWDTSALKCYENQTEIGELKCSDQLNKILCVQVVKEACMWDDVKYQCQVFIPKTSQEFENSNNNVNHLYNQKACLLISGAGYFYNKETKKCMKMDETINNLSCDQYQLNQYACLYLTRGTPCFYDQNDQLCKIFEDEQSQCNTSNLINIEVCMKIPVACVFNESTLQCQPFNVEQTMTCTQLFNYSKNKIHHNKISCASISPNLTEVFEEKECSQEKENFQKCRFEKYCYWKEYTCQVYKLLVDYFETGRSKAQESSTCPNVEEVNTCPTEVFQANSNLYQRNKPNIIVNSSWAQKNYSCRQQILFTIYEYTFTSIQNPSETCRVQICAYSQQEFCFSEDPFEIVETYIDFSNDQVNTAAQVSLENLRDTSLNFCDTQFEPPYDQILSDNCTQQDNYAFTPWCMLIKNISRVCHQSFSQALCQQLDKVGCFFDINQGGCNQLKNNEHKIPNCASISNNCFISQSSNAICQNGPLIKQPGPSCLSIQEDQQTCESASNQLSSFSCNEISESNAQPILCALAIDQCRFDGIKCTNILPIPCNCDKSYSKVLCEQCGCDYIFLGYCQKKSSMLYPQLNQDCSNKYYLCYEVNTFTRANKQKACGLVDQACKFTDKCEDATHSTCKELIGLTVSQQACARCTGLAMQYNSIDQKCYPIAQNISQCENLNKEACLSFSTNIYCQWQKSLSLKCNQKKYEFTCKTISAISTTDQIECSKLNYESCNRDQMNLCWFNPESKLCEKYSPLKGKCLLYKNKSTCMLSMVESCKWNVQICQTESNPQQCNGLNKYGCLNFQLSPCVWSDNLLRCELAQFSNNQMNCTQFLENQSDVSHMNAQTCTQIEGDQSCILGNNHKCRQILEPQFYDCETQGLNKNACLSKTKNSCAFINNKCISFSNTNQGCQTYLNEVACLNQDAICKFNQGFCSDFKFTSVFDILQTRFAPYSIKVCYVFDDQIGLIYSVIQKRCVVFDNLKIKLTDCSQFVEQFCEYKENKCQYINPSDIDLCLNTLNSFACTQQNNVLCKFQNNQCSTFNETSDFNCALQSFKYLTNPKICYADKKNPCSFNSKTKQCELLEEKSKQQLTCSQFNRKACIFNSQELVCQFNEIEKMCESSFGYSICTDSINKNKCLAIITKGQYCQFNEIDGCQQLDKSIDIKICQNPIQTNPYTCSQSSDVPCLQDKRKKLCAEYKPFDKINNIDDQSIFQSYTLSNINSFNKMTCEQFNQEILMKDSQAIIRDVLIFWKESCIQIQSVQLFYLTCDQNLNRNACISIKTQFQYCQYKNKKCINVDLKDFINTPCESIQNINSGAICAMTTDVACEFDPYQYSCKSIKFDSSSIQQIGCVEKNPEQKGYNKLACILDQSNCVFNGQCYKISKVNIQFCEDAINIIQCQQVQIEGCVFQLNKCMKIQVSDYYLLTCESAINKIGCINIQKEGQYCQYVDNQCLFRDLMDIRYMECLEIKNINHYSFCEFPRDVGCIYDFKTQSCQIVPFTEDIICQRGINRIACLTQTIQQLNCQFIDYCYDPNYGIQKCTNPNKSLCCREAGSIENCLNQYLYQCQWINNQCQSYSVSQDSICDDIQNSSLLACISITDKFCIYDSINHKCNSIIPTSCDQLQSPNQCNRMITLPCIWNEQDQYCMYLESRDVKDGLISMRSSASMNCEDITIQNGSQRACMNIVKQGQMCIFQDNQCNAFVQDQTQNNCLNNINVNSCLQQKVSDCYWEVKLFKVKKTLEGTESEQNYGSCVKFDKFDNYDKQVLNDCDSKLSYTSCLKIIREGVFCRWQNNQCQLIDDNEVIIFQPSYLKEVNQNACGLVNNGDIVKYDQNMNFCIQIQDHSSVTCITEGLNKDACLNIKFQNCYWDITRRKCRLGKPALDNKQNSCQFKNLSSYLCSQLKLDQPCGFIKDGCDFVDLDQIICNHEGLNQYACLHVKNYPCIWTKKNDEKYQCEDYSYYLPCDQIPSNVNPKVCSIIREGACYYNEQNFKCEIPNKNQTSCELNGLNIIGCVQIENCYYDQKCQHLNKHNYLCEEFPIANQLICKNAIDSCKYYEFQYGCQVAQNEGCSDESLSDQGCLNQPNCVLQADGCKCRKFIETYDCTQITDIDKCKLQNHCIVQYQQNIINLTGANKKSVRIIFMINVMVNLYQSQFCYWSHSNQCLPAQNCEDILQPFL
ncbi:unnamed protein product (macronuclear) [Paramecium tetraurelia]|uniref:Transmembrane protein n=1 Tax=Paramecium tetraurelia TaxID=5888 RepID=A0C4M2_PARTE|nr:uncharacterized protein GSPATT00006238001 [Paramecium tetraurelia]CAK65739.1 unnamed protein product [Paramecium tetraurelia]|eukprot:XP_001433136.1 hypothetical protein (macronuclear) [Paramecium tetraurelia strain d4-2]